MFDIVWKRSNRHFYPGGGLAVGFKNLATNRTDVSFDLFGHSRLCLFFRSFGIIQGHF